MNAPSLLAELMDESLDCAETSEISVITLTLPPARQDSERLDAALWQGPVTILPRGHGKCRIAAMALPKVWKVRFFNAMDTLNLNTHDVTAVPAGSFPGGAGKIRPLAVLDSKTRPPARDVPDAGRGA